MKKIVPRTLGRWVAQGWLTNILSLNLCGRLCVLILCGCCAARADSDSKGEHSESLPAPREFAAKGVVKAIEPGRKTVVIDHEAIPDFMDAMTMPFRVKTTNELAAIEAGDAVSFRLLVTEEESWIDQLVTLKTAIPAGSLSSTLPAAQSTTNSKPHHPLLDYAFTNELGQPIRLADFRGKALALTFIFTRCPIPDYCPRLSKNFEEASRKLSEMPGAPPNWHFLSVSFDTQFDTPEVLKAYGKRFSYDPNHWSFLTGPADKIAELARLSDMQFESTGGLFSHNLRTLIIGPDGALRMNFPVGGNLTYDIVSEILKATTTTN
jgi:protein SCO1/2